MSTKITHKWDFYNPQMGRHFMHSAGMVKKMSLEQILAANLTALMRDSVQLDTIEKLSARSGVGRGTVDRVKKSEVSTKLETVEKLADAFGVPVLALLTHQSEPGALAAYAGSKSDGRQAIAESLSAVCETAAEQRILTAYRIADETGRDALDGAADAVLESFQRVIADKR